MIGSVYLQELMNTMSRRDISTKKNKRTKKILWSSLLTVLVLAVGAYFFYGSTYRNRFLPNTVIDGIDVSNQTVATANEALQPLFKNQSFTLTDEGTVWKEIPKTTLGLQTDLTNELKNLQQKQNPWLWGIAYASEKKKISLGDRAFDEAMLENELATFKKELTTFNKTRKLTKNATIGKDDTGFIIVPEVLGNSFDIEQLMKAFKENLLAGKETLELTDFPLEAKIKSDDPDLNEKVTTLNEIAANDMNYLINGETIAIPRDTITSWLSYKKGKVTVDREKVRAYVEDLGKKYNTSTNPSNFKSTLQGEVSVPAGTLSWTIAVDSETEALMADILSKKDFTRSPISQGSKPSGSQLIGDTYIEVDLTNQHMWYYKNGKLFLETDIVSGKPTTPTPPGVFYVWDKKTNYTLRGYNDDGTKYASPVKYWMPIDWTGVGVHDSDWQPTYGGTFWKTNGSHGCVNTPPSVMAKLFENTELGTPVIIIP